MNRQLYCAVITLVLAICHVANASATPLDAPTQRARDAQRLATAQAQNAAAKSDSTAVKQRRAQRTARLRTLKSDVVELEKRQRQLVRLQADLGEDIRLVHALAKSALAQQTQRLRVGPIGADHSDMIAGSDNLLRAPASLDVLYAAWYALHGELAASAQVTRFSRPVTFSDGARRNAEVMRFGGQLLLAQGVTVEQAGDIGLLQATVALPEPILAVLPAGTWRYPYAAHKPTNDFARQQIFDGGWVGVLIGLCALGALAITLYQVITLLLWQYRMRADPAHVDRIIAGHRNHIAFGERRAGSARAQVIDRPIAKSKDRHLTVIASAATLLGLLGTVIGLIHTFRALALFGGTDASLAAAGISHALATTWLGLCVAIPVTLVHFALAAWRASIDGRLRRAIIARTQPTLAIVKRPRNALPRTLRHALMHVKNPLAAGAALACTFGLFFLMHWLTATQLRAPQAAEPAATITRIEWHDTPPPPPRRDEQPAQRDDPLPATAVLTLPPLPSYDLPSPAVALPPGDSGPNLGTLGEGTGSLAGSGGKWLTNAAGESFSGSDLIPISSARPKYPRAAAVTRTEGWVELLFTIAADGTVGNIRVIDAEPPGVFENAAANAMSRWLYAPAYRNGKPVVREATQLMRFSSADIQELYLDEE